jgi:hypothetical protein
VTTASLICLLLGLGAIALCLWIAATILVDSTKWWRERREDRQRYRRYKKAMRERWERLLK